LKKLEEGAFVLPSILQNNNWNVTLFDYEYYSNEYKNDYLIGEFSNLYRQNYMNNNNRDYDVKNIQLQSVNYQVNIFTKYSVIYCMPDFLRVFFINKTKNEQTFLFQLDTFVDNVSALFYLPYITDFNSKKNNFYIFENYVTHHIFEYYLTNPDVVIDFFNENVSALATEYRRKLSKEMGLNSGLQNYCENYIAYSLIGKFLLFLKENDVYDNTRIIIVSDHGDYSNLFYDSEKCPNIDFVDNFYNPITCYYFPVLFVKDFNAKGKYKTDYTLMTNADVPSIVTKDIIDNPINQFTNKKLTTDEKNNGLDLFADLPRCYPKDFQHTVFEKNSRFMYFKGSDIFDENNYMFDYGYEDK
ncbi:MAG: hypothetical protein IKN42_01870, partial [Elusimicrobia bacterium]|nr:hypothetical protein [Elusimicrobiota bacterium]